MTAHHTLLRVVLIALAGYSLTWMTFMVANASNMPLMDDYDVILAFLNRYSDAGFWQRASLIMERHNEHRIVTTRAVALLGYYVTGTANFTLLILAGATFWCGTGLILARDARCGQRPLVSALLLPLFLNLRYATLFNWGMASLNHFTQIFFAVMAIHSLCHRSENQRRPAAAVGLISLGCAVFSSGAGILLLPLVITQRLLAKQFRGLPLMLSCSLAIVVVDRVLFASDAGTPEITAALRAPIDWCRFIVYFTGNLTADASLATALGLTALALWGYAVARRWDLRYPAAFYTASLQILIGAAAATSRLNFGPLYGLETKYSPYAIVLWGSLIVMITDRFREGVAFREEVCRQVFVAAFVSISAICLLTWRDNRQSIINIAQVHWIVYPDESRARGILTNSQDKRIYDASRYVSNFRAPTHPDSSE